MRQPTEVFIHSRVFSFQLKGENVYSFCVRKTFWPLACGSWHCQSHQSIKKSFGSIVWFTWKSLARPPFLRFSVCARRTLIDLWLGQYLHSALFLLPCASGFLIETHDYIVVMSLTRFSCDGNTYVWEMMLTFKEQVGVSSSIGNSHQLANEFVFLR